MSMNEKLVIELKKNASQQDKINKAMLLFTIVIGLSALIQALNTFSNFLRTASEWYHWALGGGMLLIVIVMSVILIKAFENVREINP